MFCATCNLEYPDHLNFCRGCGQTLVRALGERATESVCCTRCGARVVHGEKFCQHCGTKVGVAAQETVIGRCQNCETYWKNSWLFCKNCGVDREQALQWNANNQNVVPVEPEATGEHSHCQYCSAAMQPFSLFCENCGMRLTKSEPLPEPLSGTMNFKEAQDEEDALSRLDDLLLDDPLQPGQAVMSFNNGKSRDVHSDAGLSPVGQPPASQASAGQPIVASGKAVTVEAEQAAPVLRLVEKERETQHFSPDVPPSPEIPTPPIVARSWREAVNVPSNPEDDQAIGERRPISAAYSDRKMSLLLDDDVEPPRPFWHVPLLLGTVLLSAILIFGVWRKARTVSPLQEATVTEAKDQSAKPAPSSNSVTTPANENGDVVTRDGVPAPSSNSIMTPAGMVYIPGGKFEMGRLDGSPEERPLRALEIKPFFLDRTEVTNQQYAVFIEATGHRAPLYWHGGKPLPADVNLPVVNVTWQDASDFAVWASKRLPTEEEWEFAARGTDGRLYPWGKNWEPTFANTAEGKAGKIVEVGRYLGGASPYGVVDLCGNVWEWTSSELRAYGTQELIEDGVMVIRGGAYDSPTEFATMSYRGAVRKDKPYPKTGFRCARDFP